VASGGDLMDAHLSPGVNEKAYAERCINGDLQAGMSLVRLLWAKGFEATILELLEVAFPKGTPTEAGFDNLADARAEAIRHREYTRRSKEFPGVMSAGGIPDVDPIDLSDIAMGD
jgi:hypothetical protein